VVQTEAYTNAFQSLMGVITLNQEILGVGLAVAAVLLLLTSTFLYYVERDNDPVQFGSIPKCMYAAMLMLTGQGTPNPPVTGDFPAVTKVAV
jgi:voltage-gated potassium channel